MPFRNLHPGSTDNQFFSSGPGLSQKENRVLASRPAISVSQLTSGKFADGYETYVNDQFFLRDWWITLRATARRILGNTEENGVFLGKTAT